MTVTAGTPVELVQGVYDTLTARAAAGRARFGRPLTLTEKILLNHLGDPTVRDRARRHLQRLPPRSRGHAGRHRTDGTAAVHDGRPAHHCRAQHGALRSPDLGQGRRAHRSRRRDRHQQEVYDFLRSVSAKYGIGFWGPGSGIIHQVVLENYAFPGGMMIGTDSHTPNAGGLGMVAIGVGGADAVDVMTGFPFNVRWPKVIGVKLTGTLSGWSAPKDVILEVARVLTVEGGTGAIVEYIGSGADTHLRDGQGHDLQHGCRDRRHVQRVRLRPQHGDVPEGHRARGHRRRCRQGRRRPPARRRCAVRPVDRDRPRRVEAADQRAALPRPRQPCRCRRRGRGPRQRLAARDLGGADR